MSAGETLTQRVQAVMLLADKYANVRVASGIPLGQLYRGIADPDLFRAREALRQEVHALAMDLAVVPGATR